MKSIAALLALTAWLSSCVPATIAVSAYAVGRSMKKSAYQEYRVSLERLNLERQRAGLAPERIPTFAEWKKR